MLTLLTDELDFRNRIIPSVSFSDSIANATGMPREICAMVRILDDTFYEEDVEFFGLDLLLDPLVPQSEVSQSGVIVNPNVTTIWIEDNDGNKIIICLSLSQVCLRPNTIGPVQML